MSEHCSICGDSEVVTAIRLYELDGVLVLACEDCACVHDLDAVTTSN